MNILYADTFVKTATNQIANKIRSTLATQDHFIIGLSGGNTPKPIYQALAKTIGIDWTKVYVTFSDERTVDPTHDDSNYKMANDLLLSKVVIPETNVLRMKGELEPLEAATEYENQLQNLQNRPGQETLSHDLMLLGLGSDGHTASLFPDTSALKVTDRLCVANPVPQLETTRLTLTYPIINNSKEIMFLVSGKNKIEIANQVIAGRDFPAAKVQPTNGSLTWLLGWLPDDK